MVLVVLLGCSPDEDARPVGDCTIAPCRPDLSSSSSGGTSPSFDGGVVPQDGGNIPDVLTDLGPDWPF
jgi:hypothetical protein